MMKSFFEEIAEAEKAGKPAAMCIVVSTKGSSPRKAGSKMIVYADGRINGTIGGGSIEKEVIEEAIKATRSGLPFAKDYKLKNDVGMLCGGSMEVYIEPLKLSQKLLIFGAGHIGRSLTKFALELGFSVTVIDERPGITDDPAFERCIRINAIFSEAIEKIEFDENTYIVIVTHKHIHDAEILKMVCKKKHAYLGMIGSKPKVAAIRKEFISKKILNAKEFDKIDSPIGIKFAANTPQEIAVSIVARLADTRNTITL